MPPVSGREVTRQGRSDEEISATIRQRAEAAQQIQQMRFAGRSGCNSNGHMGLQEIEEFCRTDAATQALLQKAIESLCLSARATHRSLRVARTIAALAGSDDVQLEHLLRRCNTRAESG